MKDKSHIRYYMIVIFVTGVFQIGSICSFAQNSSANPSNLAGVELSIPISNEVAWGEIPFTSAHGIVVNQSFSFYCGFEPNSPTTVCGVSTKAQNYWLALAGNAAYLQHSFSSAVNNIEYNITGFNQNEVITVTVSNGAPAITVSAGCYYNINGNIISGTLLSGDTGMKIKITSTEPYTWVKLNHSGGGFGCNATLDGNSVDNYINSVPFSKWATILGFSLIFLLTVVRFKRFF